MVLISKVRCLYAVILIIFSLLYAFSRPRPKLNSIHIKGNSTELFNQYSEINLTNSNSPNNKVSVGESFLIKDNDSWYQVIQLSFWRKEYLNLDFINSQLNITNIDVKSINSNNYALGKFQGEGITYSCMENSKNFNYFIPPKLAYSFDFNNWLDVYIKNLNLVFYSFKPRNYECFVVITPNINFFKNSEFEINKKIFTKIIYE